MATMVDPRSLHRLCHRTMEFRASAAADGGVTDGRTLEGHAAVFNVPTMIDSFEGNFDEVINPGAFRRQLNDPDRDPPVMQFDHGNDKRTGSTPIGKIEDLREDRTGLFVRARLFDNDLVEPIRQAIQGQAISGMSFKFRVMGEQWFDAAGNRLSGTELVDLIEDPGDRGPLRREINDVELFELGPVVFPAYRQTDVGVRSFDSTTVAMRGVLAQFGLDERCARRHLAMFDAQARRVLADEIAATFPELVEVVAQRNNASPVDESSIEDGNETSSEPADSASDTTTDQAMRYSVIDWEPADWYLPAQSEVL